MLDKIKMMMCKENREPSSSLQVEIAEGDGKNDFFITSDHRFHACSQPFVHSKSKRGTLKVKGVMPLNSEPLYKKTTVLFPATFNISNLVNFKGSRLLDLFLSQPLLVFCY
jgi:hypothetical protein